MRPVRTLLFDKTRDSNWGVPWHQDRTISVKKRHPVAGFSSWNVKGGVIHVEPPVEILKAMLTLRLFIDDCGAETGPLRLAVGSHALGRVPATRSAAVARAYPVMEATGAAGDILAMRLLVLHASSPARVPSHRRVLHVDYASLDLPPPLEWALE